MDCRTLVVDEVLARYRQHPESLVHRLEREGTYVPGWPNPAHQAFVEWLQQHVDAHANVSNELRDALQKNCSPTCIPGPGVSGTCRHCGRAWPVGSRSVCFRPRCSRPSWTGDDDRRRMRRGSLRCARAGASSMQHRENRGARAGLERSNGSLPTGILAGQAVGGTHPGRARARGVPDGGCADRAHDPAAGRDDRYRWLRCRGPVRSLDAGVGWRDRTGREGLGAVHRDLRPDPVKDRRDGRECCAGGKPDCDSDPRSAREAGAATAGRRLLVFRQARPGPIDERPRGADVSHRRGHDAAGAVAGSRLRGGRVCAAAAVAVVAVDPAGRPGRDPGLLAGQAGDSPRVRVRVGAGRGVLASCGTSHGNP